MSDFRLRRTFQNKNLVLRMYQSQLPLPYIFVAYYKFCLRHFILPPYPLYCYRILKCIFFSDQI